MMEDGGRIKGLFFFNILYHSMAVYECFQICSFHDFYFLFFSGQMFLLYTLFVLGCTLLRFNGVHLLI
jgi:hypothetical protein